MLRQRPTIVRVMPAFVAMTAVVYHALAADEDIAHWRLAVRAEDNGR
jgi:hypothetical protein